MSAFFKHDIIWLRHESQAATEGVSTVWLL